MNPDIKCYCCMDKKQITVYIDDENKIIDCPYCNYEGKPGTN